MKIALPVSRNFSEVEDLLNALHAFEARGIKEMQLVSSIEEIENGGEKCAVFDFEVEKGILYTLVHNKIVINFFSKRGLKIKERNRLRAHKTEVSFW